MKIIKNIREEAGLSQQQVAEGTELSRTLISAFEIGDADNPKFKTVEALANYFHGYRDEIHKAGKRIPRDIFFDIVNSKMSFDEIRTILKTAGV